MAFSRKCTAKNGIVVVREWYRDCRRMVSWL